MKKISWTIIFVAIFAIIVGIIVGRNISNVKGTHDNHKGVILGQEEKIVWTCSMHPKVKDPKRGKCPICFMDLIPLKLDGGSGGSGSKAELVLSRSAQKLAEIETQPVERKFVFANVRMSGKVAMNEQLMAYITARMAGRVDRLFVNYTGIAVKKGDHMAEYYSPDLLIAQRELLLAVKDMKTNGEKKYVGYGMSPEKMLKSVKKKLNYWGLTEQNINKIIESGKISQHIVLYAPVGGVVTEKHAIEGEYFKVGDRLFTIADLSAVWVMLDAYESDLAKLRYAQEVEFTTEAYPGKKFSGRISFIDPVLNKNSRTVKVRVDAPNLNGDLKPGMFVRAVVKSAISADGKVMMDDSLSGKWICPMHPEIIEDEFGKCDICEMDLVKAESLGYVADVTDKEPLVIPVTAPLLTGKRAIVYVKKSQPNGGGLFEGREVVLGPRAGGYYIVRSGLKEGEEVVVSGNFKIDSALQILAKPSMMSSDLNSYSTDDKGEADSSLEKSLHIPETFVKQLDNIYLAYFKIQRFLTKDDYNGAIEATKELKKSLDNISDSALNKSQKARWEKIKIEFANIADSSLKSKNINQFRAKFATLSALLYQLSKEFGHSKDIKIMKFHCSMAFDNKGASWLQDRDAVENPYFGSTMFHCGEKVK